MPFTQMFIYTLFSNSRVFRASSRHFCFSFSSFFPLHNVVGKKWDTIKKFPFQCFQINLLLMNFSFWEHLLQPWLGQILNFHLYPKLVALRWEKENFSFSLLSLFTNLLYRNVLLTSSLHCYFLIFHEINFY